MSSYKSGYDGPDSMRDKAQRLFGAAATEDMKLPISRSAPSQQPMRMYKKGGLVETASSFKADASKQLFGSKVPRHMVAKASKASMPIENEDQTKYRAKSNTKHANQALKATVKGSELEPKVKTSEYKAVYKKAGGTIKKKAEGGVMPGIAHCMARKPISPGIQPAPRLAAKKGGVIREGSMMPKSAKGEVQGGTLTDLHMPRKNDAKMLKKGGHAKVTSPMRRATKGRAKNVDQATRPGNWLDVGSVPEISVPKKKSMLHPKAASNGQKNSPLNVESTKKMSKLKKGEKC